MNTVTKLAAGLCLVGSSSAFGTLVPMNTIDVLFEGYFNYTDVGVGKVTEGEIAFDGLANFVSDPDKELRWTATGFLEYGFTVYDNAGNDVNTNGGGADLIPIDLGLFSINDFSDPLVIAVLQDAIDPLSVFGIDTTPTGLPVPDTAFGGFSFEFASLDATNMFGPIPSFGSVEGFFGGDVRLEGLMPMTTRIPDSTSTGILGLLGFGMLFAATRGRKFQD